MLDHSDMMLLPAIMRVELALKTKEDLPHPRKPDQIGNPNGLMGAALADVVTCAFLPSRV